MKALEQNNMAEDGDRFPKTMVFFILVLSAALMALILFRDFIHF
jgi:hypothetical protein